MKVNKQTPRPLRATIIAFSCLLTAACMPDLTIDENAPMPFGVDRSTSDAVAQVINQGSADAGEFLVYLEITHPDSPASARPGSQGSETIPNLPKGVSREVRIPLNQFSIRNYDPALLDTPMFLEVRIDAKDMIRESDETNNYFSGEF